MQEHLNHGFSFPTREGGSLGTSLSANLTRPLQDLGSQEGHLLSTGDNLGSLSVPLLWQIWLLGSLVILGLYMLRETTMGWGQDDHHRGQGRTCMSPVSQRFP